MKTFGSVCTGFDGTGIGAQAAGLELAFGLELEPAIAEVGNANLGGHIRVGDLLEQNPFTYDRVDVFHASPPCTRASTANQSAEVNEDGLKEAPLDMALANKVIEFIEVLQPQIVTIENVWAYRCFQSWRGGKKCEGIQQALYRLGYWVSVEHCNAADYQVPQTRKRMIVRAVRGGWVPHLPQPERWVGWYEAIEDILHTLPDSQFAPWQLARLEPSLRALVESHSYSAIGQTVTQSKSATANNVALLVSNAKTEYSDGTRDTDDPAFTVTGESSGRVKAFLVGKHYDAPSSSDVRHVQVASQDKPAMTVTASDKSECRAFIVDGCNSRPSSRPTCLNGEDPIFTVQASQAKGMPRAYDGVGRVVAMTPRALARFQSFPDWFILPESKTLAAKGIGNAVCPLMYQKIIGQLI